MLVEIWSDIVCPWCYIGKHRFEQALEVIRTDFPSLPVKVVFRPYQLDPSAPRGTAEPVAEAYARKFGGPERARQIMDHVSKVAADDGLNFRMDQAIRANTLDAHRLLEWVAHEHGVEAQATLNLRLMRAYFEEGRDLGDHATLSALASESGLDSVRAEQVLAGDEYATQVEASLKAARDNEIHAVPTFVIDGKWQIPGAQEVEVFLNVLRRFAEKS